MTAPPLLVASASPTAGGAHLLGPTSAGPAAAVDCGPVGAFAFHPSLPVLYVLERADTDSLLAYRWDAGCAGPVSVRRLRGAGACALAVVGQTLVVAHFFSSHVTAFGLDEEGRPGDAVVCELTGSGPEAAVQEAAHPHHVLARDGYALVADLGADCVWVLDPTTLEVRDQLVFPPGSGPRHAALGADGELLVTGELDCRLHARYADGRLLSVASSRARSADRIYPSDLAVDSQTGRIFVANRHAGTIGVIERTADRLVLTREFAAGGRWPLNLSLDGDQLSVAQRDDDAVVRFSLDASGAVRSSRTSAVARPTWLESVPAHFRLLTT